jgi:hypothetical protein
MRTYGLKPDRADVIVPAGRVYYQVMNGRTSRRWSCPSSGSPTAS